MAMIKCDECGKEISDKAACCIGCGAPIAGATRFDGVNGNIKADFSDFKAALHKLKDRASIAIVEADKLRRQVLKSQAEKDAESVGDLSQTFDENQSPPKTISQTNCEKFKAALESTIDLKFTEVLRSKSDAEKHLNYIDAQILTASVRNIFKTVLSVAPPQVEAACRISEAILAPSAQEKQNQIKAAIGFAGGTAGIGMVIAGVGAALGWGASLIASVTAVFVGTSIAGPAGWIVAGISLAAIAGYFATTSSKQTDTERFIKVLKASTARAVDACWAQYETEMTKVIATNERVPEPC